jgi:hypothetical protein
MLELVSNPRTGMITLAFIFGEEKMPDVSKDEIIAAMKEGAKEWLQEMKAEVGAWTIRAILSAAVFALGYFILTAYGWKKS